MKKFENIVIASDLDGTYLGKRSALVERNLERVRYFCENGGHFTFATGRLPLFVKMAAPNANELVNMPAITGNGTCLYDFEQDRSIEDRFINSDAFVELAEFLKKDSDEVGFRGVTTTGFVVPDLENQYSRREYYYLPDFMEKRVADMREWKNINIYKVNIMDTQERLQGWYPMLAEKFSDRFTVSRAGYSVIEVMPKDTSKAKLLKKTVKKLFGDGVTLCALGDHDNDLEMLSTVDMPFCPSNANERVKEICKKTLCSNVDGVVADLINILDENVQ